MKNKTIAILLAVFLGGLGLHRAYLGQWRSLFYLLFCWTFIPSIIGIIEGVLWANMSQDAFDMKFNNKLYLQAKEITTIKSGNVRQLMKTINEVAKVENAKILAYVYVPKNIQGKGLQLLESLYIIGNTKKVDTLKGRYDFASNLCSELEIAFHRPRYKSDIQVSIDAYKSRYYDRVPHEIELSLLLAPNIGELQKYYSCNVYRCFMSYYREQMQQIEALVRQDAKYRRYEKLIDVASDASEELTLNGDLSDQTTLYIHEIDDIRDSLFKTRYKSPNL